MHRNKSDASPSASLYWCFGDGGGGSVQETLETLLVPVLTPFSCLNTGKFFSVMRREDVQASNLGRASSWTAILGKEFIWYAGKNKVTTRQNCLYSAQHYRCHSCLMICLPSLYMRFCVYLGEGSLYIFFPVLAE